MKKLLLLSCTAVFLGGSFVPVLADDHNHDHHHEAEHHDDHDDHDHDDDRIHHYEGAEIHSSEEAVKILNEENAKIAAILEAEKLTDANLEKIHEISYSLENAIDKLIAEKAGSKTQLESIDEAIQAVHYASENHEEAKVREWFAKLEPAAGNLHAEPETKKSDDLSYEIRIKDHTFTPAELKVPAGKKIKLVVFNDDPTPEEFESDDFRREKIIAGNSNATIFVGPLEPGKYRFFGEFNLDKANGHLIAE